MKPRNGDDAFESQVDKSRDCWIWTGFKLPSGYGIAKVKVDGKWRNAYVHRLTWQRVNGPIPPGLFVLHRCDNPSCVRPDHLFVGTAADNSRDMARKGRARPFVGAREKNPNAKLTDLEISEIRNALVRGVRQIDVAETFGISQTQVSRIARREQWG